MLDKHVNDAALDAIRKDGTAARAFWQALMAQDALVLEGLLSDHAQELLSLRDEKTAKTPVEWCVFLHRHDALRALLAHGADVEAFSPGAMCAPLAQACSDQCMDCVEILLAGGAEVDAEGADGGTALFKAANAKFEKKSASIVKALLSAGAEPNKITSKGFFALGAAASWDKSSDVSAILDADGDVDLDAGDGYSALFYAVSNNAAKAAEELLRRGAGFAKKIDCDGDLLDPLGLARCEGHASMAALLYSFAEAHALRERIGKIAPRAVKPLGKKTARL